MTWARFGHRRKIVKQVLENQGDFWWAVRDSNPGAISVFSNVLITRLCQLERVGRIADGRHNLGTPTPDHRLTSQLHSCAELACTYSHGFCGKLCPVADNFVAGKGLPRHQKKCLAIDLSMCTVMVRCAYFVLLFVRRTGSLFSLCVAQLSAIGDSNEITVGICNCLSSRLGSHYWDSRATSLSRSSTGDRASRTASAMPSTLRRHQDPCNAPRQTCVEVALPVCGTSVRGCLAY